MFKIGFRILYKHHEFSCIYCNEWNNNDFSFLIFVSHCFSTFVAKKKRSQVKNVTCSILSHEGFHLPNVEVFNLSAGHFSVFTYILTPCDGSLTRTWVIRRWSIILFAPLRFQQLRSIFVLLFTYDIFSAHKKFQYGLETRVLLEYSLSQKDQGWTGLLVEPDHGMYQQVLRKNRKAWASNCCLATKPFPHKVNNASKWIN